MTLLKDPERGMWDVVGVANPIAPECCRWRLARPPWLCLFLCRLFWPSPEILAVPRCLRVSAQKEIVSFWRQIYNRC